MSKMENKLSRPVLKWDSYLTAALKKKKVIAQHKFRRMFEQARSAQRRKKKQLQFQTYLDNARATKKKWNEDVQLSSSAG